MYTFTQSYRTLLDSSISWSSQCTAWYLSYHSHRTRPSECVSISFANASMRGNVSSGSIATLWTSARIAGGINAFPIYRGFIRSITFSELSSPEDTRSWSHSVDGLSVICFTMDPSQDLLILVADAPQQYVRLVPFRYVE
jgi:hypothetical protein